MKMKRAVAFLFLLVAGVVVGALLASVSAEVWWLSWLAFSRSVGISPQAPLVLDLSVLQFTFGFSISISVAQVITIGLALVAYNSIRKKL